MLKTQYELEKGVREKSLCPRCAHGVVCAVAAKIKEGEEMLRRRLFIAIAQCGEYEELPEDEDDYLGVIR